MVTLRRHIFDGRDPILILDFLRRYSNECDAQGMSEPQAHCALEYFLDCTAADHFVAVTNSSSAGKSGPQQLAGSGPPPAPFIRDA